MTIHYLHGNILHANADVLICTTNVVGAMGKGIAKDFKLSIEGLYPAYQKHCWANAKAPLRGALVHFVYPWEGKTIYCFHTKIHWKDDSLPEVIQKGLYVLYRWMKKNPVKSIAIPPLGCGNGNLDYRKQVLPMLLKFAAQFPEVDIQLYCPGDFDYEEEALCQQTNPK